MAGIRIATYNIKHCDVGGGTVDLKRVAGIIRGLNCGMVALQEVDYKKSRSGYVDQARELAVQCGFGYYAFGQIQGLSSGNAILRDMQALPDPHAHALYGRGLNAEQPAPGTMAIEANHADVQRRTKPYPPPPLEHGKAPSIISTAHFWNLK